VGDPVRLNLGCGRNRIPGWINVDREPASDADLTVDLETLPWPWADNSVDAVLLIHVLEHLGERNAAFFGIVKELYRVTRAGAEITITVPHPRSDDFLNDPTHVRPITPAILRLFDQSLNRDFAASGHPNTPLGLYLEVDFRIKSLAFFPDEPWRSRLQKHEIDSAQLAEAERSFANVIKEMTIVWETVKG
jgi:hypothetical protein